MQLFALFTQTWWGSIVYIHHPSAWILASLICSWLQVTPLIVLLVLMFVCFTGQPLRRLTPNQWANWQKWRAMGVHRGECQKSLSDQLHSLCFFSLGSLLPRRWCCFYNYWCKAQMAAYEICMSTICITKCSYIWLKEHIAFYLAFQSHVASVMWKSRKWEIKSIEFCKLEESGCYVCPSELFSLKILATYFLMYKH